MGAKTRVMRATLLLAPACLATAACLRPSTEVAAPRLGPAFDGQILEAPPPAQTDGARPVCWAEETRPALFETVTEQRELATGALASHMRQREIRPRQSLWIAVPCPEEMTPKDIFTASLQRALKARGYYAGPITGAQDGATREAVRRYQTEHGLESATLALATAQALGLVAYD